jgi:hypothetical protein
MVANHLPIATSNWKLELDERTSHVEKQGRIAEYVGGITFVGWLLLAAIVGEGAALAAPVSGIPRLIYLVLVVVAISFLLSCLGVMVLAQAVSRVEQHHPKKATRGYILVTCRPGDIPTSHTLRDGIAGDLHDFFK